MKLISYIVLISMLVSWVVESIFISFGLQIAAFLLFSLTLKGIKLKPVELILLVYMLVALIPFFTESPEHFWGNYASLTGTFIILYMCSRFDLHLHISLVKSILLLQIPVLAIQLIALYLQNGFLLKYEIGIPFGDSNLIASVSLFNFILLLNWEKFVIRRFNIKQLRLILLALTGLSIFLTQSFTAIIILLLFTLFWVLKKVSWRSRMLILISCIIFILLLIPLLEDRTKIGKMLNLLSKEQVEQIEKERELKAQLERSDFLHGRFEVYGMALRNFIEKPLFGKGLGNISDYKNFFNEPTFRSHNLFLDLLAHSGITGFLLYTSFLLLFIIRALKLLRDPSRHHFVSRALTYGMVAIFIHSMVEPNFITYKFDIVIFTSLSILFNENTLSYAEESV